MVARTQNLSGIVLLAFDGNSMRSRLALWIITLWSIVEGDVTTAKNRTQTQKARGE